MGVFSFLTIEEIDSSLKDYRIGHITSIHPIEKGADKTLYKVSTADKDYLLSIFEGKSRQFVEQESRIINTLKKANFQTPGIILTECTPTDLNIDGKPALLLEYSDGTEKKEAGLQDLKKIGKAIASFHEICKDININRVPRYSYENLADYYKTLLLSSGNHHLTSIINKYIGAVLVNRPKEISKGLTHNDLFKDNVLWKDDNIAAVLDFGDVHKFYYPFDIAVAINAWAFKKNSLNLESLDTLIKSYENIRPLNKEDKQSIPHFMKFDCLHRIMWRYINFEMEGKEGTKKKDYIEYVTKLNEVAYREKEISTILK